MSINKWEFFSTAKYVPHAAQRLFHESNARFRVAICGRRFGKSMMAGMEYAATLLDPSKKVRGWVVGPTYDLGEKEFRVIWDAFSDLGILKDQRVKTSFNVKQGAMYIKLPWGSEVHVRSADHPQYLVGESLDWVIVSEAAKSSEETWTKYLRPALADKRGSAVFPTTPEGMNWLYDVWSWGQDPEFDEWESWQFPTWVNDRVFSGRDDPEIINLEKQLSPEEFAQEIGAEFTAFKGRIYPEWSDAVNVIDRYEYNPEWETYAGLDFGYSNPMAFVEFQVAPDDTIYIFREWYHKYRTVPDMIEEIKSRSNPGGYRCRNIFADAAMPDHVETVNRALVDNERQPFDGCTAIPESKIDVMDGVNAVREFMRPVPPKLFVGRSCRWFIREINNYKMAPEPRTGQVDSPNKPLKKHDHAMDAFRYAVVHLFRLGCRRHLAEVVERSRARNLVVSSSIIANSPEALPTRAGDTMFSLARGKQF